MHDEIEGLQVPSLMVDLTEHPRVQQNSPSARASTSRILPLPPGSIARTATGICTAFSEVARDSRGGWSTIHWSALRGGL